MADDLLANPRKTVAEIVSGNPAYQPVHDEGEIEGYIDQVLQENQQSILDFKAGKERAFGFLVGQVMKLSKGKASPQVVNELLKKKIG